MSFARELSSEIAQTTAALNKTWKRSVVQAFNETIQRTPVDTGAARGSWLLGAANNGDVGNVTITVNEQQIPNVGGSIMLYSNLPYIELLEDGSSQQSPNGMVKITLAQWPAIIRSNTV